MKIVLAILTTALLAGCIDVTAPGKKTEVTTSVTRQATSPQSTVELERTRYLALAYIAKNSTDSSTKHMAVMALALAAPRQ